MIYLLEDDDSIRKLVIYTLESQQFSAEGLSNAEAFWQAMERQTPALVLLDIMLPGEDGISVLRRLRADPATAAVPVIMLTAKNTEADSRKFPGIAVEIAILISELFQVGWSLHSSPVSKLNFLDFNTLKQQQQKKDLRLWTSFSSF